MECLATCLSIHMLSNSPLSRIKMDLSSSSLKASQAERNASEEMLGTVSNLSMQSSIEYTLGPAAFSQMCRSLVIFGRLLPVCTGSGIAFKLVLFLFLGFEELEKSWDVLELLSRSFVSRAVLS